MFRNMVRSSDTPNDPGAASRNGDGGYKAVPRTALSCSIRQRNRVIDDDECVLYSDVRIHAEEIVCK